jgi:ubiquinone biosynthesis protein COQ4
MLTLQQDQTTEALTALHSFITLTQNPADFNAIYDIDAVFRQTPLSTLSIDYLKTQPGMTEIICDRYLAPVPDPTVYTQVHPERFSIQER